LFGRLLPVISVLGLAACATWSPRLAQHAPTLKPAAQPADGLWAILDPGCPKPNHANVGAWPTCAQPFWISRGSAVVIRTRIAPGGKALSHSYRADFSLTGADPVIAQVGNDRDGFLFLALTRLTHDEKGRLVAATGAAVACPGPADGAISATPNASGCEAFSPDGVRKAARVALQDQSVLTGVAWIAAGAPTP
jgi:hypothetical protein